MTVKELKDHALELAKELGVTWEESYSESTDEEFPDSGRSFPQDREIVTSTFRGDNSYAVVLHELGHQALAIRGERPIFSSFGGPAAYRHEADAWAWAREHAKHWTPEMEVYAQKCLATYEVKEDPFFGDVLGYFIGDRTEEEILKEIRDRISGLDLPWASHHKSEFDRRLAARLCVSRTSRRGYYCNNRVSENAHAAGSGICDQCDAEEQAYEAECEARDVGRDDF